MDKNRMDVARNIYIKLKNLSPEEISKLDKTISNNSFTFRTHSALFDVAGGVNQYIR